MDDEFAALTLLDAVSLHMIALIQLPLDTLKVEWWSTRSHSVPTSRTI
ncbi:hypothetical protein [Azospirillum sp. A29]